MRHEVYTSTVLVCSVHVIQYIQIIQIYSIYSTSTHYIIIILIYIIRYNTLNTNIYTVYNIPNNNNETMRRVLRSSDSPPRPPFIYLSLYIIPFHFTEHSTSTYAITSSCGEVLPTVLPPRAPRDQKKIKEKKAHPLIISGCDYCDASTFSHEVNPHHTVVFSRSRDSGISNT